MPTSNNKKSKKDLQHPLLQNEHLPTAISTDALQDDNHKSSNGLDATPMVKGFKSPTPPFSSSKKFLQQTKPQPIISSSSFNSEQENKECRDDYDEGTVVFFTPPNKSPSKVATSSTGHNVRMLQTKKLIQEQDITEMTRMESEMEDLHETVIMASNLTKEQTEPLVDSDRKIEDSVKYVQYGIQDLDQIKRLQSGNRRKWILILLLVILLLVGVVIVVATFSWAFHKSNSSVTVVTPPAPSNSEGVGGGGLR